MTGLARLIAASTLYFLTFGAAAEICRPNEVLVGEDDDGYFCMQRRVLQQCDASDNELRCARAGCVKHAGEQLSKQIVSCRRGNEMCLHEQRAPSALIEAIGACLAGALITNPAAACFAAAGGGAFKYDTAVALCKANFGDCVEPGLSLHKRFVAACGRYQKP